MHPNPIYHTATEAENVAFARERAFGVLAINGRDGPALAHVPFILSADGSLAELHLLRSNPVARALDKPQAATFAVSGADSYVSPDWYGIDDQVPTWNYVAVHLRGTLERRPDSELRALLERQSAEYEARLAPKPEWRLDKMTPDALSRMLRMIVPCRMTITATDGTWKLSQNKPEPARTGAADGVEAWGFGQDPRVLSALMRAVPKQENQDA